MKQLIILLAVLLATISSCKKDKNIEEPTPTTVPLEKAIIGKWIEYQKGSSGNVSASTAMEYHFLNDSIVIFKYNGFQPTAVCNSKYSINKGAYPETLGYFQINGIPGQCNFNQNVNLKMLEINDSTFTASQYWFTGNPPNYFIDVVSKYRKFQ